MNERRNLFVGWQTEELRNTSPSKRVLCRKPHKECFTFYLRILANTHTLTRNACRRHIILQRTEMIHHAFDVTNIFKHDRQTHLFQSTDRNSSAQQERFPLVEK